MTRPATLSDPQPQAGPNIRSLDAEFAPGNDTSRSYLCVYTVRLACVGTATAKVTLQYRTDVTADKVTIDSAALTPTGFSALLGVTQEAKVVAMVPPGALITLDTSETTAGGTVTFLTGQEDQL